MLSVDTVSASASDAGWQYLTEEKRAKLLRFRREEDRQRGLWAELLLRSAVCSELGLPNHAIALAQNAYGKPQLEPDAGFHFNVSHSGSWVVCLTDEQPVGVDVEKHAPIDPKIAHSFFNEAEVRFLEEAASHEEREHRFYRLWTAKESCIKAVGKGLSLPLHSFSVVPAIASGGLVDVEGATWRLRELALARDGSPRPEADGPEARKRELALARDGSPRPEETREPALACGSSLASGYSFTACCKPQASWHGTEQLTAEAVLAKIKA